MYLVIYAPKCKLDTQGNLSPYEMNRIRARCPLSCGICSVIAPTRRGGMLRGDREAACDFPSDVVGSQQVWDLDGDSICTRCNQTTVLTGASLHVRGIAKDASSDAFATISGGDATRHFLVSDCLIHRQIVCVCVCFSLTDHHNLNHHTHTNIPYF